MILATHRPSAIRTRIKTPCERQRSAHVPLIDHLPLEQGLRLRYRKTLVMIDRSHRPSAIRTRIKTSDQ